MRPYKSVKVFDKIFTFICIIFDQNNTSHKSRADYIKMMYFKQLCYVFQSLPPTFRNSFHTLNQSTICDEEHYTAWR